MYLNILLLVKLLGLTVTKFDVLKVQELQAIVMLQFREMVKRVESETGLPMLLKVGKQLGFAYGTHLFFYSTETKHGDADSGSIDFVESDEVFTSTDGDLTYATAAVDPNGKPMCAC
jgi:hypothetical protein